MLRVQREIEKDVKMKPVYNQCGFDLEDGQNYCPKCGQKADQVILSDDPNTITQSNPNLDGAKPKKSILHIIIVAIAALVGIGMAVFFIVRGTVVKAVVLSEKEVSITEGETAQLTYTVLPGKAKDKRVTWKSSDETIAKVNGFGRVTALNEGVCKIVVLSNNGKTDECEITVEKARPDFLTLYNSYCSSIWSRVGNDGSYLYIDTNPFDRDDNGMAYPDAFIAILNVNDSFGLPSSLNNEMWNTSSKMGKQSEKFADIGLEVIWSYHPDIGLEVTYKWINK